jgi:4-amino-4-deoxy-L-arabinose transferase-like glycosyltransferase
MFEPTNGVNSWEFYTIYNVVPAAKTRRQMTSHIRIGAGVLLVLLVLLAATVKLESAPPLRWDEGWTMSVARNWVERNHYGRILQGKMVPSGLEAAFPVTAVVSFSFRLLDVGVCQARAPGVFFILGTLAIVYYLACRLYNRRIAVTTLLVLLFMSPAHPDLHPVLMGRQVMGEMPMMFYLLAGYAFFLSAQDKPLWAMPLAVFFWGVALITKAQVWPFWLASLLVPLLVTLCSRRWKLAGLLAVGMICSLTSARLLIWLQQLLLEPETNPLTPIVGLYYVTALVGVPRARLLALVATLLFGIPTLAGLYYGIRSFIKSRDKLLAQDPRDVIRLALLVLTTSWFGWYLILSNGWPRYLFPAAFGGSIFLAAMMGNLTENFSLYSTIKRVDFTIKHRRLSNQGVGVLVAVLLAMISVPMTLKMLYQSYVVGADASVLEVIDFLNTQTPSDSVIETYDPELFFLLKRRYHYPPDQIHIDLIRRAYLAQDVSIDYDPLAADPDYLVVGPQSKVWGLYDDAVQSGAFRLVYDFSRYSLYRRVRCKSAVPAHY